MLIDTHAHLTWDSFKPDFDDVIKRAFAAGITTIINVGTDLQNSQQAAKLDCNPIKSYSTIGLHPDELSHLTTNVSIHDHIEKLEEIYQNNPDKVVAVGECGLDFLPSSTPNPILIQRQQQLFLAHIDLAKKLNLPLIVHCREGWDFLPWQKLQGLPVVFHYFTGSANLAKQIIDRGFYLSFSCIITYPKNEALREIIKTTPLDKILAETDSPFSPPEGKRGQRNDPINVVDVVKTIAQVKNLPTEEIGQNIYHNAQKLFSIV